MKHHVFLSLCSLLVAFLCVSQALPQAPAEAGTDGRPAWAAPELDRAVSVRDGRTGEILPFAELLDILATADAVFLGETHIDETTHRVELGVYEGLAARRGGKVVLAMEMFERDAQGVLDAYLAGESSEPMFRMKSRAWQNYDTGYRPMIEFAKARGLPVVASNFPRSVRRSLSMAGEGASLEGLKDSERALTPKELFPNSPGYWRRVDNAIRGHIGMMNVDQEDEERLYSTQSLWDNSMGESCAIALDENPGSSVLHVNGGFHSAYWDGTVRQFLLRKPDAKVLTVSVMPTINPGVVDPYGVPVADYVVYTEARATDRNEGMYSVYGSREIKYRFHFPKSHAKKGEEGRRVPLLIWLADDGFTAKDGIALWRSRLGDECAIVVVEAPHRETQDDLVEGGRWFWPDSFSSDLGAMEGAVERIWAFLLRHYPLDPDRVCIAGEGTGATVVSAVSLSSSRMDARAVAFGPRRYSKIKDIPLPLPEFRGDERVPKKSLRIFLKPGDQAWWSTELDGYRAIGLDSSMVTMTEDPWLLSLEREAALRTALGLEPADSLAQAPRHHIIAESPRARLWARLLGLRRAKEEAALVAVLAEPPAEGSSVAIEPKVSPEDYAGGKSIPRCPGPFGGTTIVVLPESASASVVEAWMALEKDDPLGAKSRFHRLRIATAGGPRNLPAVLRDLADNNRKNVLIVPAAFCVGGETMRALRRLTHAVEDEMTLRWLPGLGG